MHLRALHSMVDRKGSENEKFKAIREDLAEWINSLLGSTLEEASFLAVSSTIELEGTNTKYRTVTVYPCDRRDSSIHTYTYMYYI